MNATMQSATPILASLDIERTVAFCCSTLGFKQVYAVQGEYAVLCHGAVSLHYWACKEAHIAANTACRIQVSGVDSLYAHCRLLGIVHPNAPLAEKPWGSREFGVLDPDKNLITFYEPTACN
ncbi:MAG: VOC family protein [Pseudomonadota bacterium]